MLRSNTRPKLRTTASDTSPISGARPNTSSIDVTGLVSPHGTICPKYAMSGATFSANPCGIEGCEMTSIERETGSNVEMDRVKSLVAHHFADVFDRDVDYAALQESSNG